MHNNVSSPPTHNHELDIPPPPCDGRLGPRRRNDPMRWTRGASRGSRLRPNSPPHPRRGAHHGMGPVRPQLRRARQRGDRPRGQHLGRIPGRGGRRARGGRHASRQGRGHPSHQHRRAAEAARRIDDPARVGPNPVRASGAFVEQGHRVGSRVPPSPRRRRSVGTQPGHPRRAGGQGDHPRPVQRGGGPRVRQRR